MERPAFPLILRVGEKSTPYDEDEILASLRDACSKLPVSSNQLSMLVSDITRKVATDGRLSIPSDELCQWMGDGLGKLHPVARVRFEFDWKRPQDAADCLVILVSHMKRHLGL
jgi:transcriptional regulator NrdR family protein